MSKALQPHATPLELIERRIHVVREQRVMLDSDLAELYGVETKGLKRAVKRNLLRFPHDFMIELSNHEAADLRRQMGVAGPNHGGSRHQQMAFTEQGIAMLSSVLNSEQAVAVNIEIMRAFVRMREMLSSNDAMKKQLEELERKVGTHDQAIVGIFKTLHELMNPQRTNAIGFTADVSSTSAPE
jgi:hypothetical protein